MAGCSAGQGSESIGPLWSRITGPANEGRESPPGTDAPFPNLGTIPPRPVLPDPAVRDALTAALAEERQRSRNPLDPEMRPEPIRPAGTQGDRSIPMDAPRPPSLAAAPRIPLEEAPLAPAPASAPAAQGAPAPAPALPEMGTSAPPPPPPELLAPGAGPPPPPSPDLLAPRPR